MNKTYLNIITPHGIFFKNDIDIVTVRTTEGEIGFIAGKSPLVASLAIANLYIGPKKTGKQCAIAGGLIYVTPASVTIITDAIEYQDNIDLNRAEEARKVAEAKLKSKLDEAEEIKTKFALERAINRINVKKGMYF